MSGSKKSSGMDLRRLTKYLDEVSRERTTLEDGRVLTRGEALAEKLWDLALGTVMEDENGDFIVTKPDRTVAVFIFERLEGKIPTAAAVDDHRGPTAADRIDELAKARLDAHADAVLAVPDESDGMEMSSDELADSEDSDQES